MKNIKELIELYHERYGDEEKIDSKQLSELAVNAISLAQTWINGKTDISFKYVTYDKDDAEIDAFYGINDTTLALLIMHTCLKEHELVRYVRFFSFSKDNGKFVSKLIGELEIN